MLSKEANFIEIEPIQMEYYSANIFKTPVQTMVNITLFNIWSAKDLNEDYFDVERYLYAEEIGQLMGGN